MKNIAVFCGSNPGKNSIYSEAALELANAFSQLKLNLVYGGANVGLMGVMANQLLSKGGKVFGVIPQSLLDIEIAHPNLTELHVVKTMHERKKLMSDLADGFILFPGGAGSLDEFFEIMTWYQLGIHEKPFGIVNLHHYFDHLISFLDHAVAEGFLKEHYREAIVIEKSTDELIKKFAM